MRRLIVVGALVAGGCLAPAEREHIAIEADFAGFRGWERRVPVDDDGIPEGLYGNALAGAGAPYPVGTILVAADEVGPASAWRIHAMVKRTADGEEAGGFGDLDGWELFELFVDETEVPRVMWRGTHAPAGAGYGGDMSVDCRVCHDENAHDRVLGWESAVR